MKIKLEECDEDNNDFQKNTFTITTNYQKTWGEFTKMYELWRKLQNIRKGPKKRRYMSCPQIEKKNLILKTPQFSLLAPK